MRTYTIIFRDKDRTNQTVNAVAYNFLVPDATDEDNQISVAYVPFSEVLAVIS